MDFGPEPVLSESPEGAYHAILWLFLASGKACVLIPWPVVERLSGKQRQSGGAPDMPPLHLWQDSVSGTMQQLGVLQNLLPPSKDYRVWGR